MKTIWKFAIDVDDEIRLGLPTGAKILPHVHPHSPTRLLIWVEVDTAQPVEVRRFAVIGTGNPIPAGIYRQLEYVGTAVTGVFVWHLYEHTARSTLAAHDINDDRDTSMADETTTTTTTVRDDETNTETGATTVTVDDTNPTGQASN